MILHEEGIENYKALKKSYTNKKNVLRVIDTSSKENIQYSEMTQGLKKKLLSTIKERNILIGWIKICRLTKIKNN